MTGLLQASHHAAARSARPSRTWLGPAFALLPLAALACAGNPSSQPPRTVGANPPSAIADVAEPLPAAERTLTHVGIHQGPAAEKDSTSDATAEIGGTLGPSTLVTLESDKRLSWTTYRDLEGHLVVELPGTRSETPAVIETDDDGLLIARVEVSIAEDEFRGTPTTRLRVMARRPAVHSLEAQGTGLALRFDSVAPPPTRRTPSNARVETEPAPPIPAATTTPAEAPPATAAPTPTIESESIPVAPVVVQPVRHPDAGEASSNRADVGNADAGTTLAEDLGIRSTEPSDGSPRHGSAATPPRPPASETAANETGTRRTDAKTSRPAPPSTPSQAKAESSRDVDRQLAATGRTVYEVFTRRDQTVLVVEVRADGPLAWSEFRLESPPRFVVDLPGAFSEAGARTLAVDHPRVDRARLGQFQPRPKPIARLVLDLRDGDTPIRVVRTPTGLELRIDPPG